MATAYATAAPGDLLKVSLFPSQLASMNSNEKVEDGKRRFQDERNYLTDLFVAAKAKPPEDLLSVIKRITSEPTVPNTGGGRSQSSTQNDVSSHDELIAEFKDGNGRNALHFACAGGQQRNVELLLRLCPGLVNTQDEAGESPLFIVARTGHVAILSVLLSHGADVNLRSKSGTIALHHAADTEPETLIVQLLDSGAEINNCSPHMGTPLHVAVLHNRIEAARLLLARKADPNTPSTVGGPECALPLPLVLACSRGSEGMAKLLLDHGADPNLADKDGWTPLQCAAEAGSSGSVQILLEHGADCNIVTQGQTAIDLAVQHNHSEVINVLKGLTTVLGTKQTHVAVPTFDSNTPEDFDTFPTEAERETDGETDGEPEQVLLEDVKRLKAEGNEWVASELYEKATEKYTEALQVCPPVKCTRAIRAVLYSNRSYANLKLARNAEALEDAMKAVRMNPDWSKGYYRLAHAYKALGDHVECAQQLWQALLRDKNNTALTREMQDEIQAARRDAEQSKNVS